MDIRSAAGSISFPFQYPARQAIEYLNSRSYCSPAFTTHYPAYETLSDPVADQHPIETLDQAFDRLIAQFFRDQIDQTPSSSHQDPQPPPDNPSLPYTLQINNINAMPTSTAVNIVVFLTIVIVGVSATVLACLYIRRHDRRHVSHNIYLTNTHVTDSVQTNGYWPRPGGRRRRDDGPGWSDSGSDSGGAGDELDGGENGIGSEILCERWVNGRGLGGVKHRTEKKLSPRGFTEDRKWEIPCHRHKSQDDTLIDESRSEKYYTPRETSHRSTDPRPTHHHCEAGVHGKRRFKIDTTKQASSPGQNDFIVNMSRDVPHRPDRGDGTTPSSDNVGLTQANQDSRSTRTPRNPDRTDLDTEQEQHPILTRRRQIPIPTDSGHRRPPPTLNHPARDSSLLNNRSTNPISSGTRLPASAPVTTSPRLPQLTDQNRLVAPPTLHTPAAPHTSSISFNGNGDTPPRPRERTPAIRGRNRPRTPPPHTYLTPEVDTEMGVDTDEDADTLPSWLDTMSLRVQNEVLRSVRARNRGRVNGVTNGDIHTGPHIADPNRDRHRTEETDILQRTPFTRSTPIAIPIPPSRRSAHEIPEYPDHDPPGIQGYRPRHVGPGREITPEIFLGRRGETGRGEGDGLVGQVNGVGQPAVATVYVRPVGAGDSRARELIRERRQVRERGEVRERRAGSRTGGTNGTENRNGHENGDFGQFHDGDADVDGNDDITDDELLTLRHRRP